MLVVCDSATDILNCLVILKIRGNSYPLLDAITLFLPWNKLQWHFATWGCSQDPSDVCLILLT